MKRFTLLMILLSLLLGLSACSIGNQNSEDQVTFYYCRNEFSYGTSAGVMDSEQRYVSTHAQDLDYLLSLYFVGPIDEELVSLFPAYTRLLNVDTLKDRLLVTISDTTNAMDDSQFTLGCACITMTCLELTDCKTVEIISAERSVTMSRDNLLMYDDIVPEQTITEETQ